jgi:hypothetical protein
VIVASLRTRTAWCAGDGVTAIETVLRLKRTAEDDAAAPWELRYGVPEEEAAEARELAGLFPLIAHLPPPARVRPIAPDEVATALLDSTFREAGTVGAGPAPAERTAIEHAVSRWRAEHPGSRLRCLPLPHHALIVDTRACTSTPFRLLGEPLRTLYLACEEIRTVSDLRQIAKHFLSVDLTADEVRDLLRSAIDEGLLLRAGSSHLALAVIRSDFAVDRNADVERRLSEKARRGAHRAAARGRFGERFEFARDEPFAVCADGRPGASRWTLAIGKHLVRRL